MATSAPPRRAELVLAALLAAVAAVFAYGRHITEGGLYFDDWRAVEAARRAGGLFRMSDGLASEGLNVRPLQPITWWIPNELFGLNTAGHILYMTLLSALASVALFAVLRAAGIHSWAAAAAGGLLLVSPSATASTCGRRRVRST